MNSGISYKKLVVDSSDFILDPHYLNDFTGEIWYRQGEYEVPLTYSIKGKVVNRKQWECHLFAKKLEDIIDE